MFGGVAQQVVILITCSDSNGHQDFSTLSFSRIRQLFLWCSQTTTPSCFAFTWTVLDWLNTPWFLESECLSYYYTLHFGLGDRKVVWYSVDRFEQRVNFVSHMCQTFVKCVSYIRHLLNRIQVNKPYSSKISPILPVGFGPILVHYGISSWMSSFVVAVVVVVVVVVVIVFGLV